MAVRKFDQATVDRAIELREKGLSYTTIERLTGMSRGSIYWKCLRAGAEAPNNKKQPGAIRAMTVTTKHGHIIRRFTEEEDRKILEMEAQGIGPFQIGKALGRAHNSITGRLMALARHEERAANGLPPVNTPREVA